MNNFYDIHFYKLNKFYREQFKSIERDRLKKNLSEEDYFRERMDRFNIEVFPRKKNTRSIDDGIDFIIKCNEKTFICQLKYWGKPLGKKLIKEVFGQMYLSNASIEYRKEKRHIKYLLICPFVSENCINIIKQYSEENYYVIFGEKFIELLLNPVYFMQKNIYERKN
jgi:hypothetical protein